MPTEITTTASCITCGHARDSKPADESCASCGGVGAAISVEFTESISVTVDVVEEYIPGDSERDAPRRWREADADVRTLQQPLADGGRAAILQAQRRLHGAFVDLWSLPETLVNRHGIASGQVSAAITNSPRFIALAHDLGNVAKHGSPLRTPRSGLQPRFGAPRAVCSGGVCMFRLDVDHGAATADAVDVARQAIDEWRQHMTSWGLM